MKLLPQTLFGRFLLIILMPILLLQVVMAFIFYERHWENVTGHMQNALIGEIALILELAEQVGAHNNQLLYNLSHLNLQSHLLPNQDFNRYTMALGSAVTDPQLESFKAKLAKAVSRPLWVGYLGGNTSVLSVYEVVGGVVIIQFSGKRFRSPTTYIFMLWMMGTATLLIFVSIIFMRNQIRSILTLAEAADNFGKGLNTGFFKPSGSKEIRIAGRAFIKMKTRIERQIKYRTELLAHISHDLRTPLTSLKLQLALIPKKDMKGEAMVAIENDLLEMEKMIIGYLNFAKGEGNEEVISTEIVELLRQSLSQYQDPRIQFQTKIELQYLFLRPQAFQRAISNLINNAIKYANQKIYVMLMRNVDSICIIIDDDGMGIDEGMYQDAFKPFNKLYEHIDGYGLGLAIVKSIIQAHGGNIRLAKSPYKGLRVTVTLPI